MTKVRFGLENIQFNKRGQHNASDYEDVDFASWSLKRQTDELSTLDFELLYPIEWIDEDSETGLKCTIGDEVGLFASFGNEDGTDIKRFGGYITGITGNISGDGVPSISITAADFRLALKNKIVFKDSYYLAPKLLNTLEINIGTYTQANSLHDSVVALCSLVGFTDFSLLESPYLFLYTGSVDILRAFGSASTCTVVSSWGVSSKFQGSTKKTDKSYRFTTNTADTFVGWTLYDNTTGFDLMDYPYFSNYFYWGNASKAAWGYKFVINGQTYYVPYSSSLNAYPDGILLPRQVVKKKSAWQQEILPIRDLMDASYPDTSYNCTYVGVVAQPHYSGTGGNFYLDYVGMLDKDQTATKVLSYTYEDALALTNDIATQCNHKFKINPYMQPIIKPNTECISNMSVIEGENLISAETKFDDSELINNKIVLANIGETTHITGMAVEPRGITYNGEYCNVEETTDYTTKDTVKKYAEDQVKENGWVKPSISVNVLPSFDYEEGDILYCYIPSLGIEQSLEISSVSIDSDGSCSLELGRPETTLATFLKNLAAKQKTGTTTAMNSINAIPKTLVDSQFMDIQNSPDGMLVYTGKDLVIDGVDLAHDVITDELLNDPTIHWDMVHNTRQSLLNQQIWCGEWNNQQSENLNLWACTQDDSGVTLYSADTVGQGWMKIPIGVNISATNSTGVKKVNVYYTLGNSGVNLFAGLDGYIWMDYMLCSKYTPYDGYLTNYVGTQVVAQHTTTFAERLSTTPGNFVATWNISTGDMINGEMMDLEHYYLVLQPGGIGGGFIKITRVEVIYGTTNNLTGD